MAARVGLHARAYLVRPSLMGLTMHRAGVTRSVISTLTPILAQQAPCFRHLHTTSVMHSNVPTSTGVEKEQAIASTDAAASSSPSSISSPYQTDVLATYAAPLSKTFFRIKVFSLTSLGTAVVLTPALLFAPADVGLAGRISLTATALITSSASTGIVAWIAKPYVSTMQLLSADKTRAMLHRDVHDNVQGKDDKQSDTSPWQSDSADDDVRPALMMETRTWRLRKLQTIVYQPDLIRPTSRPLATWELTASPPAIVQQQTKQVDGAQLAQQPIVRLVAATRDVKTGKLLGRWWATWHSPQEPGTCTEEGKVLRHFSVHEELLGDDWRVL